jgi:cyclopropane-fatty-acyl-phospholipid synthase
VRLAEIFERFVDPAAPIAFRAYDGSTAGPPDAHLVLEMRSPDALRYVATSPGELGLTRAYITGTIEVHGDLHEFFHAVMPNLRSGPSRGELLAYLRELLRQEGPALLRRPPLPPEEARPPWRRGVRHSKRRDAAAIAHHYDVSNRFYELLLGPSMVYSCAVFTSPDATLEEAQREKLDLVCRKLDLQPGQRLLDIGAGWGALVRHAAEHYGSRALGVTLSERQADWARRAIEQSGLAGRAEVRFLDYRDLREPRFDAISSVGVMEHIGSAQLGEHFSSLAALLRPEGRMLNHTITRSSNQTGNKTGKLIDRYVFPDGELQGPGTVMGAMHDNGLEVRHTENLREHYAMTLRAWGRNLERNWHEAVREVGERRARVWRLYMAESRMAFDVDNVEIHQFLGVRTGPDGRSGMPLRPDWMEERASAGAPLIRT